MMCRNREFFLCVLLVFLVLISATSLSHVYAEYQELSIKIVVSPGSARVVEEINPRTIVSTINIQAVSPSISHVLATDEKNSVLATSQSGSSIRIDTLGASHVTLTYDANIVSKTSGVWNLNYNSTIKSIVVLPQVSDIISVNNIPIDISGETITMPSGTTSISYVMRTVTANNFVISWNGTSYPVQVISASKIEKLSFDHGTKSISMNIDNQAPVLVIIPRSLVGGPYNVKLNGNHTQFREYYQNTTHSWIRVDPYGTGNLKIIGTTVSIPEFNSATTFTVIIVLSLVTSILLNKKISRFKI